MGDCFPNVAEQLLLLDPFKGSVIKGESLMTTYSRTKKECTKKWAMDQEGANLSGIVKFDSSALKPWEKVIYQIILAEMKSEFKAKNLKKKGLRCEISMDRFEEGLLAKQLGKGGKEKDEEEEGVGGEEEEEGERKGGEEDKHGGDAKKRKKKSQKELAQVLIIVQ